MTCRIREAVRLEMVTALRHVPHSQHGSGHTGTVAPTNSAPTYLICFVYLV